MSSLNDHCCVCGLIFQTNEYAKLVLSPDERIVILEIKTENACEDLAMCQFLSEAEKRGLIRSNKVCAHGTVLRIRGTFIEFTRIRQWMQTLRISALWVDDLDTYLQEPSFNAEAYLNGGSHGTP
jgi:hypothetical protein